MRVKNFLAGLALVAGLAPLVLLLAGCGGPFLKAQIGREMEQRAEQIDGLRAFDIRTLKAAGCDQGKAIAQTVLAGASQSEAQARIVRASNFASAECPTITGKVAGE